MLIAGMLLGLVVLGFLIKKYDSRYYAGIILVVLSGVYLAMEPSEGFDLFRHYEIYDIVQNLSLKDALGGDPSLNYTMTGLLYNIYAESSPLYIILVYLLSRVFSHKAIIICAVLVTYGIPMEIMRDVGKRYNISNCYVNLSYIAFFLMMNYLDVSGIRNTMAASIVMLAIYLDICKKQVNLRTILIYISAVLIHSSAILAIMIRLLLLIKQKYLRRVIGATLLLSIPCLTYIQNIGFSFGGGVVGNFLNTALDKLFNVAIEGGSSVEIVSAMTVLINICARGSAILAVYLLYLDIKKKKRLDQFDLTEYGQYAFFFFAVTLSFVTVYDMFVRLQFFVACLSACFLPAFVETSVDKVGIRFKGVRALCVFLCLLVANVGYFILSYRWMDACFF